MYVGHRLLRTQFLPLFVQRRCPARSRKVWGHRTVSRSDGLWRIQGTVWRKSGAVRTLRPASFKHKDNTLELYSQQLKTNFRDLYNHIRFYLWKRKIPPKQRSDGFCRGESAAKWIECVAGRYVLSGQSSAESGGYHGEHHYFFSRIWNKG